MYLNQSLSVRWNSTYSSSFSVSNGVKQGGIISPILYCIYIDDLLLKLKHSGYGCTMGYNYCGALGYADDLILLSPTVSLMKLMLGICETYAKKHKINFNANKSLFLFFPGMKDNKCGANFYLNCERLAYVNSAKHIGHMINSSVTGIFDLKDVISRFNKSVNMLMAQLGN